MSVPILYHYPMSPYSEKLRLTMGLLQRPWLSAQVAAYPPRAALAAVVGGYRRIPVLQIGAHIYCDTRLAFAALLGDESGHWSLTDRDEALRQWAEQEVFFAVIAASSPYRAVRYLARELGISGLLRFLRDRIVMTRDARILQPDAKTARDVLSSFVRHLDDRLTVDACLSGPGIGYLDLCCFHPLWMACQIDPRSTARWSSVVRTWFKKIQDLGHGECSPATSQIIAEAIAERTDFSGGVVEPPFLVAEPVTVRPSDYARDESRGILVSLDGRRIVLERPLPAGGRVFLHFPRHGFEISRQSAQ
jgi:glutathione S-transferase